MLQGAFVAVVLHHEQQLGFGLGVKEKGSGSDIRRVGDLLRGDLIDTVCREEFAGRGDDPFKLLLLVAFASSWHRS